MKIGKVGCQPRHSPYNGSYSFIKNYENCDNSITKCFKDIKLFIRDYTKSLNRRRCQNWTTDVAPPTFRRKPISPNLLHQLKPNLVHSIILTFPYHSVKSDSQLRLLAIPTVLRLTEISVPSFTQFLLNLQLAQKDGRTDRLSPRFQLVFSL